ncbi:MAG: histidine--tRNA ligase [Legionellales bacterium RIFCSPHIGHO2_12_FULL_37_14]|nr:MAG: histidine--tRNA ligase [Legionellales bacterium RIFCSPHIGHO2_12_FULL_37_14]
MAEIIQAIRGMNDTLPTKTLALRELEEVLRSCVDLYGYQEIRLPLLENTQLFKRTIGEVTDIVEKEMYTFTDLNGESISLRPEGTAGTIRACLEHGLLYNQIQRLWYLGPMFRHERPQKGRYRQFNHFGVEAFGIDSSAIDLELLSMCAHLWNILGLNQHLTLEINSLGTQEERKNYRQTLVQYFLKHKSNLDEDSIRRLDRNPLRILDSKNPAMQEIISNAPSLLDFLTHESQVRFAEVCSGLTYLGINYAVNKRLVRGLDYYGHTVFEWVTDKLGSQATVCAGGRYNTLVEHLGGKPTPAIGFSIGIERLVLLQESLNLHAAKEPSPKIYMVSEAGKPMFEALAIANTLRHASWSVLTETLGSSFKQQFKKANQSGALIAVIIGEEEYKNNSVSIKWLREDKPQVSCKIEDLIKNLQASGV